MVEALAGLDAYALAATDERAKSGNLSKKHLQHSSLTPD